jgi:hypothetical protein
VPVLRAAGTRVHNENNSKERLAVLSLHIAVGTKTEA